MDLSGIPLFSVLQNKLGYLSERQKFIAQNVANASTPGFTPQDLKAFDEQPGMNRNGDAGVMRAVAQTVGGIPIQARGATGGQLVNGRSQVYASTASPDSETTLSGNQVVLEEQMIKMNESRSDYDTAVGFYQKALGMLHMAVRKPGS